MWDSNAWWGFSLLMYMPAIEGPAPAPGCTPMKRRMKLASGVGKGLGQ